MENPNDQLELKIDYSNKYTPTINKCSCTIEYPHSHLVAGYQCECEKGSPKNTK